MVGYWRLYFLYNILSPVATRPYAMHELATQISAGWPRLPLPATEAAEPKEALVAASLPRPHRVPRHIGWRPSQRTAANPRGFNHNM